MNFENKLPKMRLENQFRRILILNTILFHEI